MRALYPVFALWMCVCALYAHDSPELQIDILNVRIAREPSKGLWYFQRAELERAQRQWSAARHDYDQALRLQPTLDASVLGQAFTSLGEGNAADACRLFETFLIQQPGNTEGLLGKARCLGQLHRPIESAAAFTELIHLLPEPRPETFLERAEVFERAGLKAEALAALEEGIRILGPIVSLEIPAIQLDLDLERCEEALGRLSYFVNSSARPETWLARRADVYQRIGRTDEARQDRLAALSAIGRLPAERAGDSATRNLLIQLNGKLQ